MNWNANYYVIFDRDGARSLTRWSPAGVADSQASDENPTIAVDGFVQARPISGRTRSSRASIFLEIPVGFGGR